MIERLRSFYFQSQSQGQLFYKSLTKGRKIALGASILATALFLIAFSFWKPETHYEPAFSGLSPDDKTAILGYLKKNNVKDFKMEGDSIFFPEEKALDLKMGLAQEGLPNSGTGAGWEKFDDRTFGMTDFEQRINRMRAIQGELSRTINKLEPVSSSRVHIVAPEPAIFAEEKRHSTASISLRLKPGKALSQRQLQGIMHLVAHAVEALEPQHITIIDQDGNMLTKPEENDGGVEKVNNSQREYQRRVEKELEGKIKDILERVVGNGKVIAKVDAELDFKKVETTIQDVDPERTAVLSSVRSEQSSNGSGLNPTGVPGAKSNLPGEREDAGATGSQNNSKQNNETLNFEIKKTFSKIVEPTGSIKKLSTAVLVDGRLLEGKFVPRPQEEVGMITKLVKNAIGFQEGRDSLTVETAQFELDEFQVAEQASLTARRTSLLQTGIFASIAIAGMIFLYFAVVRPYFRWLTFDPDKRSKEQFAVVDYELERSGSNAKRVQVQEEVPFEKLSPKEQIMFLAKNDPKKTTEAIRQLLSPNQN
jgi:flagellar M-ring protein FliF